MSHFTLHIGSTIFPSLRDTRRVESGRTIQEAVADLSIDAPIRPLLRASLNGVPVPPDAWQLVRPKAGTTLTITVDPAGFMDNGTRRTLAVLAAQLGGTWAGNQIGGFGGHAVGIGLQILGVWAATTLIPPPPPDPEQTPTGSGFQGDLRLWGKVPRVYGHLRLWNIPMAAQPITDVIGNEAYSRAIFLLGQKPLHVLYETIRLGESPLSRFQDFSLSIQDGWHNRSEGQFAEYSRDVVEESVGRELRWAKAWRQSLTGVPMPGGTAGDLSGPTTLNRNVIALETAPNCTEFQIDLTFPDGLGHYRGEEFEGYNVDLAVRYRPLGARGKGSWMQVTPVAIADQAYINEQLHPITGTKLFEWLERTNDVLDETINNLTAITEIDRVITDVLFDLAMRRITEVQTVLIGNIDYDTDLTPEQLDMIEGTQTKLDDIAVILQTATRTTEAFTDDLINFNSYLSAFITVLETIDGILAFREYIRRGYAPGMPPGPILRLLVSMWNLEQVFSKPPEGAFRLVNVDRVKGVIRKKLVVPTATAQYEVQVRRVSKPVFDDSDIADATNPDPRYSDDFLERVEFTTLRTVQKGAPLSERALRRHAMMAMKIRLSNQLATLDNLNVEVQSPLPWYKSGDGWQPAALADDQDRPVYKCPAWICCEMVMRQGNKRPATEDRVDAQRFAEFAEYCFEHQLYFSGIFDAKTTLHAALEDVCRVAKAQPCQRNGQYSVTWDHAQDTPVDVITPRNSAGFMVRRVYPQLPHALRIPYLNADKDYADDEIIVYDDTHGPEPKEIVITRPADGGLIVVPYVLQTITQLVALPSGYTMPFGDWHIEFPEDSPGVTWLVRDQGNWPSAEYRIHAVMPVTEAERFETVSIKGLVDSHDQTSKLHTGQAYRFGRYLLKSMHLRPETIECRQDFEHLAFERGDRVDVQHDVTMWGLGSARLVAVERDEDDLIVGLTLDAKVAMAADKSYQVRVRDPHGVQHTADLITEAGASETVALATPLDAELIARGDLAIWGERSRILVPCTVKSVEERGDLVADITLIEHAAAVHDAAEEPIPPFDSQITEPPRVELARPPMPEVVSIASDESVLLRQADGSFQSRIRVAFRVPDGASAGEQVQAKNVAHIEAQFALHYRAQQVDPLVWYWAPGAAAGQTWISAGMFAREAGAVYLGPVEDGASYDVRLRCITRGGVPGDWAMIEDVVVVGKTTPPPDVRVLMVDGDALRWEYPDAPSDLAGFLVRQLRGQDGGWEAAAPAHEGIITSTRFPLADFPGGPRLFLVRAVDTTGNLSARPARAVVGAGDAPVENVVLRYSHRDEGWPGYPENMEVDSDDMVASAGTMAGFYAGPGAPYYRGPDAPYYTTEYPEAQYIWLYALDSELLPCRLSIDLEVTGELWQLEVGLYDAPFWPENLEDPIWPSKGVLPVWPDILRLGPGGFLGFQAYRGPLDAVDGVAYLFRVRALGSNTQLVISKFDLIADVRDLLERVEDFEVAATGTVRLPLSKTFRKVATVQLAVQQDGAHADARTVELIDKDETGPAVAVYDAAHNRVSGIIDAIVQGY